MLNAPYVDVLIKPFQSRGLIGERDVHKKVLELPFPQFDAANPRHSQISSLGASARAQLHRWRQSGSEPLPTTLARQRATVRAIVRDTLDQIDELVKTLLG